MGKQNWTVWVGGVEINDYYLPKKEAKYLKKLWISRGYNDVQAEKIK